jgi:hypothetical protein
MMKMALMNDEEEEEESKEKNKEENKREIGATNSRIKKDK